MISNFNEETKEIINKAKSEMLDLNHPYIGTEHLVLSLLKNNQEIANKLKNYNLTYNIFKDEIIRIIGTGTKKSPFFLYTPLLKKVIENAILDSKDNNNGEVTPKHLFSSLLEVGEGIAIRIFISLDLDIDSIYDEFHLNAYKPSKTTNLLIENLGIDLTKKAKEKEIDPIIGREKEIQQIIEVLCRKNKNNPLLIGEPGVGKTAIIEQLSNLISKGKVPNKLLQKRIISLDMASAVAGTKYRGEFEERIKKILNEIEDNQNIILFIDEIHTLIGAGGAEGAIDASNILKPALARGKIKCIGATTKEEYKKHFFKDKALERRFEIINIEEPTIEQTKKILMELKPIYEKFHNVIINENIIDSIIELTEKYVYNHYRPDKQIDILDQVCSKVSITNNNNELNNQLLSLNNQKNKYIKELDIKKAYECKIKEKEYLNNINSKLKEVTLFDVAKIIENKTSIPIYEITNNNKELINKIKKELKSNIIGQDDAINCLVNIAKRIKLGYKDNSTTSILFTGIPGTGKTKTATLFSKLITNKEPITVNMSEYSEISSLNKFYGSQAGYIGYEDNNYILNNIKDNPNSTIIFEDIDKAHPKLLDIINKILETGLTKDSKNNTINFKNNIIILTTNKNQEQNNIGYINKNNINTNDISTIKTDYTIHFNPLNKKDISKIIYINLNKLKQKFNKTNININNKIIEEIINESLYKIYGSKRIDKIIKNKIEPIIIDNLIDNNTDIIIDSILAK